jgi:hypothetical protein
MSVIELNPPPLKTARLKRIPSGYQIDGERAVRLRLPKNANALDLLRAIYRRGCHWQRESNAPRSRCPMKRPSSLRWSSASPIKSRRG